MCYSNEKNIYISDSNIRDMDNTSSFSHQNREHMLEQMLANLRNYNFVDSFPPNSNLPYIIPIRNRNLANLKAKINEFVKQYPKIINDIKNYFYDDFIVYMLKRTFDPSFTKNDVTQTNQLLQKFFTKYQNNIEIIVYYFFDDLKPLIWNIMPSDFKSSYPYGLFLADSIPKLIICEAVILYLKKSGATYLTSLMYPDQMHLVQQQNNNLAKQSFSDVNKYFLLASFFLLLCIILGSEIFRFLLYYFLGLICTVFALYLFVKF
jgi:hypothetical protein